MPFSSLRNFISKILGQTPGGPVNHVTPEAEPLWDNAPPQFSGGLSVSAGNGLDNPLANLARLYNNLMGPDTALAGHSAAAIAKIIAQADSSKRLLKLQRHFGQYSSILWSGNWNSVTIADLKKRIADPGCVFPVLALGIFHPRGYFRERCLTALEDFGSPALPFVILSLNSWVKEIRLKAFEIARRLIEKAPWQELLPALAYMAAAHKGQRLEPTQLNELNNAIRQRLAQSPGCFKPPNILPLEAAARSQAY